MHRKIRITGRLAHWAGVLWLALFVAQLAIAVHDELSFPTDAVNFLDVRTSVKVTAGFLAAIGAVNVAAWTLASWWRRNPPPYLDWMIKYNVRVAVLLGCTTIFHTLATRLAVGEYHQWLLDHLSLGYALGTIGALAGAPLLFTRRWHQDKPAAAAAEAGAALDPATELDEHPEPPAATEPSEATFDDTPTGPIPVVALPPAVAEPVEAAPSPEHAAHPQAAQQTSAEPVPDGPESTPVALDDTPTGPIPIVQIPPAQPENRD